MFCSHKGMILFGKISLLSYYFSILRSFLPLWVECYDLFPGALRKFQSLLCTSGGAVEITNYQ